MATAKQNKGLGRGFDSLIPKNFDSSLLIDDNERVQKLFILQIFPNPDQPRKHFDETAIEELASSIKRYGVLQPLVVRPKNEGYEIIAGERRWRAAQVAGLKTVPALVRTDKELERLEIALVENVQRVDLSPLEQAVSIQRLHEQFSLGYDAIAKRLGKAQTTVNNIVRLLQLSPAAQTALQDGAITEGHARAILALKGDAKKQQELLMLIQKHQWSVREAERFVSAHKAGSKTTKEASKRVQTTNPATKLISKLIAAPVNIRRTAKGGKLEIGFTSDEELAAIIKKLSQRLR